LKSLRTVNIEKNIGGKSGGLEDGKKVPCWDEEHYIGYKFTHKEQSEKR